MSLESDVYSALQGLVSGRCYPEIFPLTLPVPAWPSIRYSVVSQIPAIMLCGDTGTEANDTRIQIDAVSQTYAGAVSLAESVVGAMAGFDPPAVRQDSSRLFDAETKTYRVTMDFIVYASGGILV